MTAKSRKRGRPIEYVGCRVEGCGGDHRAKGFCQGHYWQFVGDCKKDPSLTPETWDPDNRPPQERAGRPKSTRTCRVPDCGEKHRSKGFCPRHNMQFYRDRKRNPSLTPETWDPNNRPPRSPQKRGRKPNTTSCRVPGCDGKHYGLGFCESHYNAFYYDRRENPSLTPNTWVPPKGPRPRGRKPSSLTCRRVPDCGGKYYSLGFCSRHYQQFLHDRRENPSLTPDTWDPNNRPGR